MRLNVLLLLAAIASALYLVHTQYESRRLFMALESAQKAARELATEHERLQVEKRAQSAPTRIESMAHEQGLLSVTPGVTHYVQDNAPAAEAARADTQSGDNAKEAAR